VHDALVTEIVLETPRLPAIIGEPVHTPFQSGLERYATAA